MSDSCIAFTGKGYVMMAAVRPKKERRKKKRFFGGFFFFFFFFFFFRPLFFCLCAHLCFFFFLSRKGHDVCLVHREAADGFGQDFAFGFGKAAQLRGTRSG